MNSQIKIKQLADHTFSYEIILKDPINYWYDDPAEYTIFYLSYSSANSKMIFKL